MVYESRTQQAIIESAYSGVKTARHGTQQKQELAHQCIALYNWKEPFHCIIDSIFNLLHQVLIDTCNRSIDIVCLTCPTVFIGNKRNAQSGIYQMLDEQSNRTGGV